MQTKKYLLFISLVVCEVLFGQSLKITVTNPAVIGRSSETITLNLESVFQSYPEFRGKNFEILESAKKVVHQLIDENSDGLDDILIFQSSFKPKEKKIFLLRTVKNDIQLSASMVDGRFVLPRQDFAWENDRIAFRVYGSPLAGDVKNGIDVWTKRVRYPIVEKWYKGEEQTPKLVYHEDHGEGADYFSVGKSLGCGGTGILLNGKLLQTGLFSYYRKISNGPIRVSFELYYPDWRVDTVKYLEVKRVTLDAGSNLNKIEERFIANTPNDELNIAVGLVKRKNTQMKLDLEKGWMTLWGLTTADSLIGSLGTAVVIGTPENLASSDDESNWLLTSKSKKNFSFTYYAGAGWTKSGDFKTEKDWIDYVDKYSALIKYPLTVVISKK